MGPLNGIPEIASAADAAISAGTSGSTAGLSRQNGQNDLNFVIKSHPERAGGAADLSGGQRAFPFRSRNALRA